MLKMCALYNKHMSCNTLQISLVLHILMILIFEDTFQRYRWVLVFAMFSRITNILFGHSTGDDNPLQEQNSSRPTEVQMTDSAIDDADWLFVNRSGNYVIVMMSVC